MRNIIFTFLFLSVLTTFGQKKSEYKKLKEKYENAKSELDHGDVHFTMTHEKIRDYENFINYLKAYPSKNNTIKALEVSSDMFGFYNWELDWSLKEEIIKFAVFFQEILNKNKSLAKEDKYRKEKEKILKSLEEERLKFKNYIKQIKKVESKLKKN